MDIKIIVGLIGLGGAIIGGVVTIVATIIAQNKIDDRQEQQRKEQKREKVREWYLDTYIHGGFEPVCTWLYSTYEALAREPHRHDTQTEDVVSAYRQAGLVEQMPVAAIDRVDAVLGNNVGLRFAFTTLGVALHNEEIRQQLVKADGIFAGAEIAERLLYLRKMFMDAEIERRSDVYSLFEDDPEVEKLVEEMWVYVVQIMEYAPFTRAKEIAETTNKSYQAFVKQREAEWEEYLQNSSTEKA